MQKKSSESSGAPVGGIVITMEDLNSPISIRSWIKNKLGYNEPELSNELIISALEGIARDPIFIDQPDEKRRLFTSEINNLINKLKM
jgi:hypothetical protein